MRRLFTITTILFPAVTLNAKVKPIEERPAESTGIEQLNQ